MLRPLYPLEADSMHIDGNLFSPHSRFQDHNIEGNLVLEAASCSVNVQCMQSAREILFETP
jgi:hypothetical protein